MKSYCFIFSLFLLSHTASANPNSRPAMSDWQSLTAVDTQAAISRPLLRDPFSDPQTSYSEHGSAFQQNNGAFGSGFQRGRGEFTVPELIFKGYIESDESDKPMALIQIGKDKVHMVKEGDEINIDPSQPRNAIRITNINRLSITVETGILGTVRVLR